MCLQAQREFAGLTSAPGEARRFCREHLGPVTSRHPDGLELLSTTELVVTELVTNAVNAATTGVIIVEVALHRRYLWISVHDNAPGQAEVRWPTKTDEHGRGLLIIEAIARKWGSTPVDGGKQVWVELEVPAHLTAALDCALPGLSTSA